MTIVTCTISEYHIPYNGSVSLTRTYCNGRLSHQYLLWRDEHSEAVSDVVTIPNRVSKVKLLRAIYWMGLSIKNRSSRRILKEASRPINHDFEQKCLIKTERFRFDYSDLRKKLDRSHGC